MIKTLKKNSNKGFTLVELIIVIAIMAVLASVISLSIIRYIEKGRQTIDINNAKLIKDAVTAHAYPSDFGGESVTYTDPETHESETFRRGWVYVDKTEIRCSDPSTALAMIDAGLVEISDEAAVKIAEYEDGGPAYYPNPGDGDYIRRSNIDEYVFHNKMTVKATNTWNTYQIDVYIDDIGELHLGASASNAIRKNGHAKDAKTASMFAERLGLDGSKITPIGEQYNP
ncbi:MAG: prepilin-type N-terminal cleavage/methylation domain-containing protein [Lachnospiraceae bacterium]|nr:prepilin-type N-terminal cleavage/methylation domain-containing protein [Lachnospiraceae bacterium]